MAALVDNVLVAAVDDELGVALVHREQDGTQVVVLDDG
jgi:hypothetical protein